MVDIRGFPLSTEQGAPLVSEKDAYPLSEYGKDTSPSVVCSEDSALRVVEQFSSESEVSRSLLGIDRKVKQQGLFGNVSTYGLDFKDWRVDYKSSASDQDAWWRLRPSASGNYYYSKYTEDSKNSSIVLSANPTPFLEPVRPSIQNQLEGSSASLAFGRYINSVVALYVFKYLAENRPTEYRFNFLLSKYPLNNGSFNKLYWDKIWLDITQDRFGSLDNYPLLPPLTAYNFKSATITNWRTASLWGSANVLLPGQYSQNLDVSWNSFFFGSALFYFPTGAVDNYGHFKLKANPTRDVWEKYLGLDWDELRTDLKNWEFTVHEDESTVTQLEKDLKLPHVILNLESDQKSKFSQYWPEKEVGLPTFANQIGGSQGIFSEVTLKSNRAFRYQPGRISGFTFGVRLSEIGAGPGTILEFGAENDTDSYMFRLTNGSNFSIVRRSTVPLESDNQETITTDGVVQYQSVIEQNLMNGDPLSGSGESGYVLNPDTVTMYKIEFGWYGAIGARFYAYIPTGSGDSRWVTLHTLIIENKLDKPCLSDPYFHFKYRLRVEDSSAIRLEQSVTKFGASYYIDGYDEGTAVTYNVQSRSQTTRNPQFSGSKILLNAIDWKTLLGVKPKQFSNNGIYNRKEVFPKSLQVYSQTDCEIKVVKQSACPEWAYSHQEGYVWNTLPESRRLKAKFIVNSYSSTTNSNLGISSTNPSTFSATASYNSASTGSFKDPRTLSNWDVTEDQVVRVKGQDLFALIPSPIKDFSGSSVIVKLQRDGDNRPYLSSRTPDVNLENVRIPFLFSSTTPVDVEFDYFRRDQILLSSENILGSEFFIYWVGNPITATSIRLGVVWPETSDTLNPLHTSQSGQNWGIETSPVWDGQNFYEGLPYDFVGSYENNTLYVETNITPVVDTYNLEVGENPNYEFLFSLGEGNPLSVPGLEGGECKGLFFKSNRDNRRGLSVISETNPATSVTTYYVMDTTIPWPTTGSDEFSVTLTQGATEVNVTTTGGIAKSLNAGGDVVYLLPIGTSLPVGITASPVDVSYNVIYLSTIDKKSRVREVLVTKIAPGNIPFYRAFIQGRQGARVGGVWIGQKSGEGVRVSPFTPHRSTLSVSDSGTDYHSQWSASPQVNGAVKAVSTYTQLDGSGVSTSPTFNASESSFDSFKSVHTNRRKCGSFEGASNTGILTSSQYPLRWLTSSTEPSLGSYYITANTPTKIDLTEIFNINAESIFNDEDGNLATFFIVRNLNNEQGEIFASLNYTEQ
jgi:hypothetical protein